jgi:nicotinate-nucleotide adenylyltransferase
LQLESLRLGIFGGTFDPIHNAHLTLAHAAVAACRLDQLLFIPAARPPHRTGGPHAPYADRLRMVELAIDGTPRFMASRLEAGDAVSYSIDTIEKISASRPGAELFFVIGADAFAEIRTWKRWQDVVAAVQFIVAARPGADYRAPAGAVVHGVSLQLGISSSGVRELLAQRSDAVPVPPQVLEYIWSRGLYTAQ